MNCTPIRTKTQGDATRIGEQLQNLHVHHRSIIWRIFARRVRQRSRARAGTNRAEIRLRALRPPRATPERFAQRFCAEAFTTVHDDQRKDHERGCALIYSSVRPL